MDTTLAPDRAMSVRPTTDLKVLLSETPDDELPQRALLHDGLGDKTVSTANLLSSVVAVESPRGWPSQSGGVIGLLFGG